jgi:hypothetical protein
MAKLMNPLMSTEARGRVGGIVYNTWRGIRYGKVKTSPAQPRTARQLVIRAFCVTVVRRWAILTGTQREGWNTYATAHPDTDWTGAPQRITGSNWFVRCSVRLLELAKTIVDTAPVAAAPANVIAFVPTGAAGQISCAWTPTAGTTTSIDLWTHGPHSAGVKSTLVRAKHRIYGPGETSPLVIPTLPAGLYTVYARNISETDGLASAWVSADATVT